MTESTNWMPIRPNKSGTFVHRLHKGLHDELADMSLRAQHSTDPKERAAHRRRFELLTGAISQIAQGEKNRSIDRGNEKGGHALGFLTNSSDLSDCETTYVWDHPDEKPPYRIVWRQRESRTPGKPPLREFIAAGDREDERVYDIAGERLHRPKNISLTELVERTQVEARKAQETAHEVAESHETAAQNHRGTLPRQSPPRSLFDSPSAVNDAMSTGAARSQSPAPLTSSGAWRPNIDQPEAGQNQDQLGS